MIDTTIIVSSSDLRPKLNPASSSCGAPHVALTNNLFTEMYDFYRIFAPGEGNCLGSNIENKPNLNISKWRINTASKMTYHKSAAWDVKKTNPIQTQYKPKQTQFGEIEPILELIVSNSDTEKAILKDFGTVLTRLGGGNGR